MVTSSNERLKLSQDGILALKWLMNGEQPGFRRYVEMVESEQHEALDKGFGELVSKNLAHAYGGTYGCGENLELYGESSQHQQWLQEALDSNVNPDHYRGGGHGIESYKLLEFLSFHDGCGAKYLMRLGKKDVPLQELKKSEWYILHYIELMENYEEHFEEWVSNIHKFFDYVENSPDATDADRVVALLLHSAYDSATWLRDPDRKENQLKVLHDVLKLIQTRIAEVQGS